MNSILKKNNGKCDLLFNLLCSNVYLHVNMNMYLSIPKFKIRKYRVLIFEFDYILSV